MAGKNKDMTMMEHLEELRRVLLISIMATFIMAIICWVISDQVLRILLEPISSTGNDVVYIGIVEALMTKIKVSFFLGFLTALPVILWQFWKFILPALRKVEKIYFTIFVVISYIFFISGVLLGFYAVFRVAVKFLLHFGGNELIPMLTIGNYISFTIMFLLPFGIIFELPLGVYFLAKLDLLSHKYLVKKRKLAICFSVVTGAVLIPSPDILTPLMMAAPIYLLYEFSVGIVRFVEWGKRRRAGKQREREMAGYKTTVREN
ncbi:Sec-independent protein translocase TatC [Desulfotomaculum arcticum]|uniref:Sec-independent protein translocase protein TatC n=1 Tax=Desulfotruncus arcticus DSM 17038 TaxID=1121424 RepID=A0A1I2T593_9FIRM|nr:twin-arginine translocase subunit TatC [Desulfotruncus arcticus]SFG58357.1 Sec-independent protein translocase TatC [Desulfotomaculum arcticum] [Desulfotruncus arcticus DSM 17038]